MVPRKNGSKKIALNLNVYRNMHHHINNQVKKAYKELMRGQLVKMQPLKWPVKVKYHYYLRQKCDVGNIHAVVDKFFLDALVELGRLPDDNIQFVSGASYMFAGIDRQNPRAEIEFLQNYQQ